MWVVVAVNAAPVKSRFSLQLHSGAVVDPDLDRLVLVYRS